MRERFAAWFVTGPLGHLASGIADWAVLIWRALHEKDENRPLRRLAIGADDPDHVALRQPAPRRPPGRRLRPPGRRAAARHAARLRGVRLLQARGPRARRARRARRLARRPGRPAGAGRSAGSRPSTSTSTTATARARTGSRPRSSARERSTRAPTSAELDALAEGDPNMRAFTDAASARGASSSTRRSRARAPSRPVRTRRARLYTARDLAGDGAAVRDDDASCRTRSRRRRRPPPPASRPTRARARGCC